MSKIGVMTRIEMDDRTLVVRNRYMSRELERSLTVGYGILAITLIACLFTAGKMSLSQSHLRDLPYFLIPLVWLGAHSRFHVCFCENQVTSGLLLNKGLFLFCRSWNLSEFESVTLESVFGKRQFRFVPKEWQETKLRLSVPKKSEALISVVRFLSNSVEITRLDANIRNVMATASAAEPPSS